MDNLVCAGIVIIAILLFVYILCNGSLQNKKDRKENFQAKYPFKYNKICGRWPDIYKTGIRPGNSESRVRY